MAAASYGALCTGSVTAVGLPLCILAWAAGGAVGTIMLTAFRDPLAEAFKNAGTKITALFTQATTPKAGA